MEDKVKFVRYSLLNLRKQYEDKDDYALLTWAIRKGFPRVTIWTQNKRPEGVKLDMNTVITAPFDYITFTMFRQYFLNIINNTEPDVKKYTVECYNVKFVNNQRTNELYVQARVTVGRDKDNVIYIAVIADEKPKIKFDLLPNPTWFKFYAGDKNLLEDKGRLSTEYAKAYLDVMDKLYTNTMVEEMTDVTYLDAPINSISNKKPGISSSNTSNFIKPEDKPVKTETQSETTPISKEEIPSTIEVKELEDVKLEPKATDGLTTDIDDLI